MQPMTQMTAPVLSWKSANAGSEVISSEHSHDSFLAAETVRKEARHQRCKPGATCHGSSDAALDVGLWTSTWFWTLVEVTEVSVSGDAVSVLA